MPDLSDALKEYHQKGTAKSREELIMRSLPLVRYVVKRYAGRAPRTMEREDLIDSGVCGLIEAVERFDPSRNVKFETYAILRIKGAVLDELRARDPATRSARRMARQYEEVCAKLEHADDGSLDPEKVAAALGLTPEEMERQLSQVSFVSFVSIDEELLDGDEDASSLLSRLQDTKSPDPTLPVQYEEKKQALMGAIRKLDEQQRLVITLYYFEGFHLKEIGELLGVTESRVSQVHTQALRALKEEMKEFL